jgi:uncharacterized protein (TIGR02271 family)
MINETQIQQVIGTTAVDADGDKIGKVSEIYLDDETGRPEWATVNTGLFGTKETFVPLAQADLSGDNLRLPYDKAKVKDAPKIDTDGHLSPQEEQELYRYYGLGSGQSPMTDSTTGTTTGTAGLAGTAGTSGVADTAGTGGLAGAAGHTDRDRDGIRDDVPGAVGHDTSGPTTDDAMTRSEERLDVGTRSEEVGRARLRKYVVTENVSETVPVSREEVRVEREPITDANVGNAMDGPAISEEEHEVTLHAERPVVEKEAVPVERVRLDKETVSDQERVSADVRKEEIEVDGGTGTAGNANRRDDDGRIGR